MIQDFDLTVWGARPFQSNAEMIAAMKRPEYRDPYNDAYRNAVAQKIDLMGNDRVSVRVGAKEVRHEMNSTAAPESEAGKAQAAEIQEAETTAAENFGKLAVRPAPVLTLEEQLRADEDATEQWQRHL